MVDANLNVLFLSQSFPISSPEQTRGKIEVVWDRPLLDQIPVEPMFLGVPEAQSQIRTFHTPILIRTSEPLKVHGLKPGRGGFSEAPFYSVQLPPLDCEKRGATIISAANIPSRNSPLGYWIKSIKGKAVPHSSAGAGRLAAHENFSSETLLPSGIPIVNNQGELVTITLDQYPGEDGHGVCACHLQMMAEGGNSKLFRRSLED